MLDKLDQIDWSSLAHAYGSAEDVPDLLRNIASLDQDVHRSSWSSLYSSILFEGGVCEAATRAVPFLLELLERESVPERQKILIYLVDLANATCYLEAFEEEDLDEEFYGEKFKLNKEKDWAKETRLAVQKGMPVYRKLLTHPDEEIRSAAAYTLGNIRVQTEEVLEELRGLLDTEQDELVIASVLFSLSDLKDNHPTTIAYLNELIQKRCSLTGIVSAMVLLRSGSRNLKAIELLVDTLKNADEVLIDLYSQLPPNKLWLIRDIFKCFGNLPLMWIQPFIPDVIKVFQRSKVGYVSLVSILLQIVFKERQKHLILQDLSQEQIFVLEAIAEFDLLWQDGGLSIKNELETIYGLPYFDQQEELKKYLNM